MLDVFTCYLCHIITAKKLALLTGLTMCESVCFSFRYLFNFKYWTFYSQQRRKVRSSHISKDVSVFLRFPNFLFTTAEKEGVLCHIPEDVKNWPSRMWARWRSGGQKAAIQCEHWRKLNVNMHCNALQFNMKSHNNSRQTLITGHSIAIYEEK